jgi:hypothetical protein
LIAEVFTQTDPMPMSGGAYEQSYAYGGNNPAMYGDPSGLRKKAAGSNVGRKLVVKHRVLINSMSARHGLDPKVAALILMGENDFGRNMAFLSRKAEGMDPFGDPRVGVANLHSWDLVEPLRDLGTGTVKRELAGTIEKIKVDTGRAFGGRSDYSDSWVDEHFSPQTLINRSGDDEDANIRILILNLAATAKRLRLVTRAGPLSFNDALVLSRKTGGDPAVSLYAGRLREYNAWLSGPPYNGDTRLAATRTQRPSWLNEYAGYKPEALL